MHFTKKEPKSFISIEEEDSILISDIKSNEHGANKYCHFKKLKLKLETYKTKATTLISEISNFVTILKENLANYNQNNNKKTLFEVRSAQEAQFKCSSQNPIKSEANFLLNKKRASVKSEINCNLNQRTEKYFHHKTLNPINNNLDYNKNLSKSKTNTAAFKNRFINSSQCIENYISENLRKTRRQEDKISLTLQEAELLLDQSKWLKNCFAQMPEINIKNNSNQDRNNLSNVAKQNSRIADNFYVNSPNKNLPSLINNMSQSNLANNFQYFSPLNNKSFLNTSLQNSYNLTHNWSDRINNFFFPSNPFSASWMRMGLLTANENDNYTSCFISPLLKKNENQKEQNQNSIDFYICLALEESNNAKKNDNNKCFHTNPFLSDDKKLIQSLINNGNAVFKKENNCFTSKRKEEEAVNNLAKEEASGFFSFNSHKKDQKESYDNKTRENLIKGDFVENDNITFNPKLYSDGFYTEGKYERQNENVNKEKNDIDLNMINQYKSQEGLRKEKGKDKDGQERQIQKLKESLSIENIAEPNTIRIITKKSLDDFLLSAEMLQELHKVEFDLEDLKDKIFLDDNSKRAYDYRKGKKYKMFSPEFKNKCIKLCKKHGFKIVSAKLEVPIKSLKRWFSVGSQRKKGGGRKVKDPEMEMKLRDWIQQYHLNQGNLVTAKIIKKKALEFKNCKDFIASKGWLEKFRKKYNVKITKEKAYWNQIKMKDQEKDFKK